MLIREWIGRLSPRFFFFASSKWREYSVSFSGWGRFWKSASRLQAACQLCRSTPQYAPRQARIPQPGQREHLRADQECLVLEAPVRVGRWTPLARLERRAPEYACFAGTVSVRVTHVAPVGRYRTLVFSHQVRHQADPPHRDDLPPVKWHQARLCLCPISNSMTNSPCR